MKGTLFLMWLVAVNLVACRSPTAGPADPHGYLYTHAETTGNSEYLKSITGEHYEIEFSRDSDPEAKAALECLDPVELSPRTLEDHPRVVVYGRLDPKTSLTRNKESGHLFRLDDWRIEMPCTFYDRQENISLLDEARGVRHSKPRLITHLDQAPRTYLFKGEKRSYRRFETARASLSRAP